MSRCPASQAGTHQRRLRDNLSIVSADKNPYVGAAWLRANGECCSRCVPGSGSLGGLPPVRAVPAGSTGLNVGC